MDRTTTQSTLSNLSLLRHSETGLSLAFLGILVVLLIPVPPMIMDMLLATNLALSILLLLITTTVKQPLDISVFPSLLLLLTLYRLSLNVATTRLILLSGDAGRMVSTFGGFVVGGNFVVGLVIFLILIIIQFIVITKGAGRVSEVAARFTLDAMPGKQMAIDAELNAGIIDENEARSRRKNLASEAEFYGSMDGASKFVRGDAMAGLVITAINLVGGALLGTAHGLSLVEAIKRYSILTVGDGLVSQIPALIVATTAGVLVTKSTSQQSLGRDIGSQLLANHRPLLVGAAILVAVSATPGLPKLPFLAIAVILYLAARRLKQARAALRQTDAPKSTAARPTPEQQIDEFLQHDRACVEIGTQLIPLVDSHKSKGLADRITSLRRDLARKHGMWVPAIRIRDNFQLEPDTYRVLIAGREVARGQLRRDEVLVIDPRGGRIELEGQDTTDPAFGLPAKWISPGRRQRAELKGYTVVEPENVLITHLSELLRRYAHELLSRQDLQRLLDKVKETSPTVVEDLKPEVLRISELHQIMIHLLEERVPISNLTRILEAVTQHAPQIKDRLALVDKVREVLGRDILDRFRNDQGRARVLVLEPRLEIALRELVRDRQLALGPTQLERLIQTLNSHWQKHQAEGQDMAVLVDSTLRRPLRKAIDRALPELPVVAYAEVPTDVLIDPIAMLRRQDVFGLDSETNAAPATVPVEATAGRPWSPAYAA